MEAKRPARASAGLAGVKKAVFVRARVSVELPAFLRSPYCLDIKIAQISDVQAPGGQGHLTERTALIGHPSMGVFA